MTRVLRDLAHARAGDKGDLSDIAVIAIDPADYELLRRKLTPARVKAHFRGIVTGEVERYEVPLLGALKFVLHGALSGGVTRSLRLDPHGKSLSSWILDPGARDRGVAWHSSHAGRLLNPERLSRGALPCARPVVP